MAKTIQRYAHQHLVSLNRFDISIEKVMDRMWALLGGKNTDSLIPTLIGIDIEYRGIVNPTPLFTGFLDQLIKLRDKHFVRFVTDTIWAVETYNGHLFYAHDGQKDEHCDVVWTISAMNDNQVEIGIRKTIQGPRHELVTDLANNLKKFVPGVKDVIPSGQQMVDIMLNFYRETARVYQTKYLNENFHILLTPTESGGGYYPIPLCSMSYHDARRHFRRVVEQQAEQRDLHYDIFDRDVPINDMFHILLQLIQNTHKFDSKTHTAQERYNLAELLFGMWATYHTTFESIHDMILFHTIDPVHRTTHIEIHSMDEMFKFL